MATIATQLVSGQRRIITKVVNGQRRVSCSCCEEPECCMYPAAAVESGLITFEDLPDILLTEFVEEQYQKVESPFTYTVGDESFTAYYGGEFNAIGIRENDPNNWIIQIDFAFAISQQCLISELIQDWGSGDWVFDNFADTYLLAALGESVEVARQSLCLWTGTDSCGFVWELAYGLTQWQADEVSWNVYVNENTSQCSAENRVVERKDNFQNTPVGTYGEGLATVSEP